jgi:hypothetical protein
MQLRQQTIFRERIDYHTARRRPEVRTIRPSLAGTGCKGLEENVTVSPKPLSEIHIHVRSTQRDVQVRHIH